MKTISTGFLAGFLVAINRMDRLTCYICDSVIHKVMAACLRCEEWEKSLSLFRELCPGTDLRVSDQAATGFPGGNFPGLKSKPTVSSYAEALCSFHQAVCLWQIWCINFSAPTKIPGGFFEAQKWEAALQTFLEVSGAEDEVVEDC